MKARVWPLQTVAALCWAGSALVWYRHHSGNFWLAAMAAILTGLAAGLNFLGWRRAKSR